jgi:hypothetical protein
VALPGTFTPASISLRVIGARKPSLHDKAIVLEENCYYYYIILRGIHTGFWWESRDERHRWEDNTLLEWILEKQDGVVWTELIWLRIGTSGGLL